jgi:hypothetical protein
MGVWYQNLVELLLNPDKGPKTNTDSLEDPIDDANPVDIQYPSRLPLIAA